MELRCRGIVSPDPMEMTLGELWAHKRILLTLDARDAARAAQAAAVGSRAKPADMKKHMAELGVGDDG